MNPIFNETNRLENSLWDVGSSYYWPVSHIESNKRLWSFVKDFHYLFTSVCSPKEGLDYPSITYEVLTTSKDFPSQLHPISWPHVKVFRYWYEYKNGIPTLKFFLDLFNMHRTYAKEAQGQRLFFLLSEVNV